MQVRVIRPADLGPQHINAWDELSTSLPDLASPYFCSHFTLAVAEEKPDVFVAVVEGDDESPAFLPFQRTAWGIGEPAGSPLSDYHGLIGPSSSDLDAVELVRRCGLRAWDFDHLVSGQRMFAPCFEGLRDSPVLQLAGGFPAYEARLRERGSRHLAALRRKQRKLGREVGPVRFEWHDPSPEQVDRVVRLKSQQCRETGTFDFFRLDWTVRLAHRIAQTDTPGFAGVLSVLYAGDTVAALHLGMRSQTVLHWWFPVYNRDCARYSPGQILLMRLAEAAAERGIATLDLGAGDDAYKSSFQTGAVKLAHGAVVPSAALARLRSLRAGAVGALRRSPLRRVRRLVRG